MQIILQHLPEQKSVQDNYEVRLQMESMCTLKAWKKNHVGYHLFLWRQDIDKLIHQTELSLKHVLFQ